MPKGSIPILQVGSTLVVTIQTELRDTIADALQEDLLERIGKTRAGALIIDITGLEVVDTYVARIIATTGQMAKLMGTETVLVGMRREVAATIVRIGFRLTGVETALNLDEGLELAKELVRRRRRRKRD